MFIHWSYEILLYFTSLNEHRDQFSKGMFKSMQKKKIKQKNQPKKTRGSAKTFLTYPSPLNNEKPILSLNN